MKKLDFSNFKIPAWFQGIWKFLVLVVIVIIIIVIYLHYQWKYPATNDANVHADVTAIAPQVSGIVQTVDVKNNQYVHKGQLLFTIDAHSYQLAVAKAQADMLSTMQNITAAKDVITGADAKLQSLQLAEQRSLTRYQRYRELHRSRSISRSMLDTARAQWREAQQAVTAQKNIIASLQHKISLNGNSNAALKSAQATLAQAQLNLDYTRVVAPSAGYVTNLLLTVGAPVIAYQAQFSIVDADHAWITANYLEFELRAIRPGQLATIHLLMYPDHDFKGIVQSIGYGIQNGSGVGNAVLPDVAPSLNWIRLAQRFPVRIKVLNTNKQYPLRVGANARVTIDTTQTVN